MLTDTDIAAMRTTLRHAANHLDEVREDLNEPYHAGDMAPADANTSLVPLLTAIEEYALMIRHAVITMITGGLSDVGGGDWYLGSDGPYDTLAEAQEARRDDADDPDDRFISQGRLDDLVLVPRGQLREMMAKVVAGLEPGSDGVDYHAALYALGNTIAALLGDVSFDEVVAPGDGEEDF